MEAQRINILYEVGACLAVNKPSGVLTQAPPGIDSLEVRIKEYLRSKDPQQPEPIYLGIPHRLDRPASGVILFGTKHFATKKISSQFERRTVKKIYWALVEGHVEPASGTWEDRLHKIPGTPQAIVVPPSHSEGRHAVLHYRVLAQADWGTWLEITLETGRTHQIRVQSASRGHPLLGDGFYGGNVPFGEQFEDVRERKIALHARMLDFYNSAVKDRVQVVAPPPAEWTPFVGEIVD